MSGLLARVWGWIAAAAAGLAFVWVALRRRDGANVARGVEQERAAQARAHEAARERMDDAERDIDADPRSPFDRLRERADRPRP